MLLSWIDNRTLFTCQTLLAVVYAIVFLSMGRMHRHLPGTGSFALGFLSGFLGCVLIVMRGSLPHVVSIVLVNFLLFSAFVLFYRGILLFFRSPRTTRSLWILVGVALPLLMYFSTVNDQSASRIAIISLVFFLSRSLIAVELFRQAGQRGILNVFAVLMATYALFGVSRTLVTFLHGTPYDLMQTSSFQTPALVVNFIFICIIGLFVLMLSSELVAIVEAQSLYDHVSGALNRRGIDQRLALELVRAQRKGYQRRSSRKKACIRRGRKIWFWNIFSGKDLRRCQRRISRVLRTGQRLRHARLRRNLRREFLRLSRCCRH
jgi:hypothetical protein